MTLAYPAAAPSTDGTLLTVDRMLKNPTFLAKRIVPSNDIFLSELLFRPGTTDSGAVIYAESSTEDLYPKRGDVEQIEPGSAYPMVDVDETGDKVALSTKWGAGYSVYEEAEKRNSGNVIAKGNMKVRNALVRQDAARMLRAFERSVPTVNAVENWTVAGAWKEDILRGKAQIKGLKLGYTPDTMLISPNTETELLLLPELQNWAPRENVAKNPLYAPSLAGLLGFNWVVNEFVEDGDAIMLQQKVTGANIVESPYRVRVVNKEEEGRKLVLADKWGVPIVDEPGSALVIKGVLS